MSPFAVTQQKGGWWGNDAEFIETNSLLPILPRGEGNLVPPKDGWVKRSGVKLPSPPVETEGWKPPRCLFPHNQAREYTDFLERHSASVNFGCCSYKKETIL